MGQHHGFGIHLPNGDMDLSKFSDVVGDGCYTLLHPQAGVLGELRRRQPSALVLVRMYTPNWCALDPRQWARDCAEVYRQVKGYTKHLTWANEQQLRDESGGVIGADAGHRATADDYRKIHTWNLAWLDEFKRQAGCADAILHYPAFATGHSDDQNDYGFVGLDICRPGIEQCHILDRHYYWDVNAGPEDKWGCQRIALAHALFPDHPIFVSEAGNFAVTDPRSPEQYAKAGYVWQALSYCLGWTYFIGADPTRAHQANDMSRNEDIFTALRNTTRMPKADILYTTSTGGTPVTAPSPQFVLGFKTFHDIIPAVIGDPLSNETGFVVDGQYLGQAQRTTNGVLQWLKAGNVMFFISNDGSVWAWNNGSPKAA